MIDSWWHSEAAVTVLFTESALGAEVTVAWTVTFNPSQKPKPSPELEETGPVFCSRAAGCSVWRW